MSSKELHIREDDSSNLSDCEQISFDVLDRDVSRYDLGMYPEYRAIDAWQRCRVRVDGLRDAHGVFRDFPLHKGKRFVELLQILRDRIEDGTFPCAEDIVRHWPNKPPLIVSLTRCNGELYVLDGEKRTLNACYHTEQYLDALVVTVDEEREIE